MTHSYFISHKAISNCMLYVCVMKPSTNCYYKISAENSRGRKTTVRNQVTTHSRAGQNCVRFPISSTGSFSTQSQAFPSHTVIQRQRENWGPSSFVFRWVERILAREYNGHLAWICLSLYLCSTVFMAMPTQSHTWHLWATREASAVLCQVFHYSWHFHKSLMCLQKGSQSTKNVSGLEKTELTLYTWQFFTFLSRTKPETCEFSILLRP